MPILTRKVHKVTVTPSATERGYLDLRIEASSPEGERLLLELTMSREVANSVARQITES